MMQMTADQWAAFGTFRDIVRRADSPERAWRDVLQYVRARVDSPTWDRFVRLDMQEATALVQHRLREIFAAEPIPEGIQMLYFGLADMWNPNTGKEFAGYYISGCPRYDPADPDTLCDQQYFPKDRFIRAAVLDEIREAATEDETLGAFIAYAMLFAAAAILTKFGLPELDCPYRVFVGFDEGDAAEIR